VDEIEPVKELLSNARTLAFEYSSMAVEGISPLKLFPSSLRICSEFPELIKKSPGSVPLIAFDDKINRCTLVSWLI
jgi:hypothetical protein